MLLVRGPSLLKGGSIIGAVVYDNSALRRMMLMMQIREPRPNIRERMSLLRSGTWRRQMMGMGRMRIRMSVLC